MTWEEQIFDLLDSLEARAQLAFSAEREAEIADRLRAEYRTVTWTSRLHASVGTEVLFSVQGIGPLRGGLARVGAGWCLVEEDTRSWLVFADAIVSATGLSPRSVPDAALSAVQRLGPGSPLRLLADDRTDVLLRLRDGAAQRGRIGRVGADLVELSTESGTDLLIPWSGLAAVRSMDPR